MKIVKEHINEKFSEKSDPIKDMGIGEVPFNYNNLYIAKHDIEYTPAFIRKKILVPKGTVLSASGGGMFSNRANTIRIANIEKINGKNVGVDYSIAKDKDNYIEIYNDVWDNYLTLDNKIEIWIRDRSKIEAAAKNLDVSQVYKEIEKQNQIINKIKNILK